VRDDEFEGRTAFVTAAGEGIGRAVAMEYLARGGSVVATDIRKDLVDQVRVDAGPAGDRVLPLALDVADLGAIREVYAKARDFGGGGIDALFNVAGINIHRDVEEMEEDEWDRLFDVNLKSIYRLGKLSIPDMRKRGGGSIVNIASVAGILAENRCGAYSASKGGVLLLTRNMAIDFGPIIRVNAICPGSTRTPRIEKYWEKSPTGTSEIAGRSPLRRAAEPEEIARPAIFLASSDASYITGATLVVDGGISAGLVVPTFARL
jgi:meso-butanediol dehydrogenase/(S,S)-butanediol dehydrogenase/diacetyl reductase